MSQKTGSHPVLFIVLTFSITWACAFFLAYQQWFTSNTAPGVFVLQLANFIKSASPLLAAFVVLRRPLFQERGLVRFLFGDKPRLIPYLITAALFLFQLLTFYFSRTPAFQPLPLSAFISLWGSQLLFGGGMEEGGWRGYLQPFFEKKVSAVGSVLLVGIIWAAWHLPYFFLPGNMHSGGSFLFYCITTTATAYTLTAIYKLTGSIVLCSLFHSWQNAIVMSIPADMAKAGFLLMFIAQTAVSIFLCIKPDRVKKGRLVSI